MERNNCQCLILEKIVCYSKVVEVNCGHQFGLKLRGPMCESLDLFLLVRLNLTGLMKKQSGQEFLWSLRRIIIDIKRNT